MYWVVSLIILLLDSSQTGTDPPLKSNGSQRPKFLNQAEIFLRRRNLIFAKGQELSHWTYWSTVSPSIEKNEGYYFILQDSVGLP